MEAVKVYFTKEITPESLVQIYKALDCKLEGNVGVKISTGEPGGHNYLKPELIKDLVKEVNGTIVENCTAYGGLRQDVKDHWQCIHDHGFDAIAKCDILDEEGEFAIPTKEGSRHLKEDIVGDHMANYDSILMLSHFKGHAMGGFGGALKNMSIGLASTAGKLNIHAAGGENQEQDYVWSHLPEQDAFLESMAEACSAIMKYYEDRKGIVYINVINNLSVDCDCDSHPEDPCMKDIGIVASLDPVACDRAALDLIYKSNDPGREHFLERVETRHGAHTIEHAVTLGLGTTYYQLEELK
ncbi:MAG: DUF362 domain-containing protein [Solobacterium sp.]|nr:DUF362 domain-containing protein [Solobacterium sp.]